MHKKFFVGKLLAFGWTFLEKSSILFNHTKQEMEK